VEKAETAFFSRFDREADLDGPSRRKAREEMGAIPATPVSVFTLAQGGAAVDAFRRRHSTLPGPWNSAYRLGMKNGVETAVRAGKKTALRPVLKNN